MKSRANSAASRRNPEVGKWVTVTVNGNHHQESRILISPYTMREFENLLSHLTEKLKPSFGAVWRLFTEDGHEIKKLDEIRGGSRYVASGRAKPFPLWASLSKPMAPSRRELRSQSAVGNLGSQQALHQQGGSSETNLKQCRSAPRRRKVGEQSERTPHPAWDQPHHLDQQQRHKSDSKRRQKKGSPDPELSEDELTEGVTDTLKARADISEGTFIVRTVT